MQLPPPSRSKYLEPTIAASFNYEADHGFFRIKNESPGDSWLIAPPQAAIPGHYSETVDHLL
jgi:hypothetical protein